jgi:hypothetical protein
MVPFCPQLRPFRCRLVPGTVRPYRDIRANMEHTWDPKGLDHSGTGRRIAAETIPVCEERASPTLPERRSRCVITAAWAHGGCAPRAVQASRALMARERGP